MLETDDSLRKRIVCMYPLVYMWHTAVVTATGVNLDAVAKYWGLERENPCTEQETDIK